MTPFDKFLQALTQNWRFDMMMIVKLGVWLFLLLYIMFSLVVVKQIKLMSATINGAMEDHLTIMAWVLVAVAVAVFIMSLIIL